MRMENVSSTEETLISRVWFLDKSWNFNLEYKEQDYQKRQKAHSNKKSSWFKNWSAQQKVNCELGTIYRAKKRKNIIMTETEQAVPLEIAVADWNEQAKMPT